MQIFVRENATIPTMMMKNGNSQIYVESSANILMSTHLLVNSATQNVNAPYSCKGLVIDEIVARSFLPFAIGILREKGIQIKGDKRSKSVVPDLELATDKDYLEDVPKVMTIRVVRDINEAILFVNAVSAHLCDMIVTKNPSFAEKFLNEVDSALVYVNASLAFTNGYEFGIGEDLGISVQKTHARGLIEMTDLTSTKVCIFGNGQIKD